MLQLKHWKSPLARFPAVHGVEWFNLGILVITPLAALYGVLYVPVHRRTAILAIAHYLYSTIGITAGYHRLWSHRAYTASYALRLLLLLAGTSAVQGSCSWWARRHRSHHRYTDTDSDPYNARRGLLWSHVGWMVLKTELRPGAVDAADLRNDALVQWQHRNYLWLCLLLGFVLPTAVPGLLWGDWRGGFCFVSALRMMMGHHSVFCVNSIAHYLGHAPYDDKHSPRDHFVSAVLTLGEGYHNFHHQFPMDYRNAFRWYQFDPTKWFIRACAAFGLAHHLRQFPSNEIEKGRFTMRVKELKRDQDTLRWPPAVEELPIVTWEEFQEQAKARTLVLISGFVHDATEFVEEHPGGEAYLRKSSGKDMTASFFGGVYDHSNAAHNLLSMMRVGILAGGVECLGEQHHPKLPASQRLYIASAEES